MPPNAPVAVGVTALSATRVEVAWTPGGGGEDGFWVERSPDGNAPWEPVSVQLPATSTTFVDTGLAPATMYWWRVVAFNSDGSTLLLAPSTSDSTTTQPAEGLGSGVLGTIRRAIAIVIRSINEDPDAGVSLAVYPTLVDAPSFPCVVIEPASINYLQVYQSPNASYPMRLTVLTGRTNEVAAQELLDDLLAPSGPRSIPAAIGANPRLVVDDEAKVDFAVPTAMGEYGRFTIAGQAVIGATITVEVAV